MTPRQLRDEILQTRPFTSLEQEAFLSLGRTWAVIEHAFSEGLRAELPEPIRTRLRQPPKTIATRSSSALSRATKPMWRR